MNIALLTAEYPPQPGGVGDYTNRLALALAAQGHTLTVVTSGYTSSELDGAAAPVNELRTIPDWGWSCWSAIIATLVQVRPDVLHIQYQTGAYGMHPAINLLPWRLRHLPGRPRVVVTFHDLLEPYLFPKAGPLRRWITLRLARDADRVIVTNGEDADTLQAASLAPATVPIGSNIPVAPPTDFDRAAWRAALGLQTEEQLIVYFGLLSRNKGVDLLIAALEQCAQRAACPPLRLVIVGGAATAPYDQAYAAEVTAQIERSPLRDRIQQTGHLSTAHVSAHLLASDLVVLPFRGGASLRSGSLLAALLHGCAIITTTTPSGQAAPPLTHEHQTLLVSPDARTALAEAITRLAADPVLQARLGAAARELGRRFDWATIARAHEQLYHPT